MPSLAAETESCYVWLARSDELSGFARLPNIIHDTIPSLLQGMGQARSMFGQVAGRNNQSIIERPEATVPLPRSWDELLDPPEHRMQLYIDTSMRIVEGLKALGQQTDINYFLNIASSTTASIGRDGVSENIRFNSLYAGAEGRNDLMFEALETILTC